MESILLGDPFNFLSNWPAFKVLADVPSCSLCARNVTQKFVQPASTVRDQWNHAFYKSILLVTCKLINSHIFTSRIYKNEWAQKLFHNVTRATKILLFYNYLPDKRLKFKPNSYKNDCFGFKVSSSDIQDPKKWFAKCDKHYSSRSGQTSLAKAVANFNKPRTSHFFDLCIVSW